MKTLITVMATIGITAALVAAVIFGTMCAEQRGETDYFKSLTVRK